MATADERRGRSDPNIENGLPVEWACERILAAAAAGVEEVWIARPRELFMTYLAQYSPTLAKMLLTSVTAKLMEETLEADAGADAPLMRE